jgi:transcription initiation factor TFIID subunit 10
MTENMEDSSSSNDETSLIDEEELNKFTSTLDQFSPVIPETVTRFYMRQCGLQTDDDRVVKLLSISVQKFMSGNGE